MKANLNIIIHLTIVNTAHANVALSQGKDMLFVQYAVKLLQQLNVARFVLFDVVILPTEGIKYVPIAESLTASKDMEINTVRGIASRHLYKNGCGNVKYVANLSFPTAGNTVRIYVWAMPTVFGILDKIIRIGGIDQSLTTVLIGMRCAVQYSQGIIGSAVTVVKKAISRCITLSPSETTLMLHSPMIRRT